MKLTLVKKLSEAKGTTSFFWKTEKKVSYLPGQYFYYTLPKLDQVDSRGATRHFTISSSPTEGTNLRLTTRIREESGFKKTLDNLKIGSIIEGEGPNGTYILDKEKKNPQVFLAGGIGITPYRSFIKYAFDNNFQTPFYVIYSNSTPEEIAFKKELESWEKQYSNLKITFTVSNPKESKEKWNGSTGRIDEALIRGQIENWKLKIGNCNWWVSGPPPMVDAVEGVLEKMKISPSYLFSEKFSGY